MDLSKKIKDKFNICSLFKQIRLFPFQCFDCLKASDQSLDLCSHCEKRFKRLQTFCPRCANPSHTATLCGRCQNHAPYFNRVYAPFKYDEQTKKVIHALKFNRQRHCAKTMSHLMMKHYPYDTLPDAFICTPLHHKRLLERTFNQTHILGHLIAKEFDKEYLQFAVKRTKDTPTQRTLNIKKRKQNLSHAFEVEQPIHAQHVAIIDDVMTTGATANEIAKVLKKAGVQQVDVWVFARA